MAGVEPESIAPLAASHEPDAVVARAVEVVTDLTVRGYPSRPSASLVRDIAERDAAVAGARGRRASSPFAPSRP